MSIWLVLALCGFVALMVWLYAACYVSGSVEDLERQAELQARLMRVDVAPDGETEN